MKIWNQPPPPHRKTAPSRRRNFRIWPRNQPESRWRPFFFFLFWRPLDFGRKKPFNFGFGPKIRTQLRRSLFFFFFFWRPPNFERKNPCEFPSIPRNFVWIFGQSKWNWFKKNENPGQVRLHFSHSFKIAPPFPNPGYAPGRMYGTEFQWRLFYFFCPSTNFGQKLGLIFNEDLFFFFFFFFLFFT